MLAGRFGEEGLVSGTVCSLDVNEGGLNASRGCFASRPRHVVCFLRKLLRTPEPFLKTPSYTPTGSWMNVEVGSPCEGRHYSR